MTLALLCALTFAQGVFAAEFASSFGAAKKIARTEIYFDQNQMERGTVYCGCKWTWKGRSGGRVDWESCGYEVRAQENRAIRTEWEMCYPRTAWATNVSAGRTAAARTVSLTILSSM
jgi:deoxyribonuclease-1